MQRFLLVLLFIASVFAACGSGTPDTAPSEAGARTVIYMSRHAEKGAGQDPDLLPAGMQRAERLAKKLARKNIAAVYATGYKRTQATAAPTAEAAGLTVKTYSAAAKAEDQVREWLTNHRGQTILVVGHSNTVPGLVNALVEGANYQTIDEGDYNNLFRVIVNARGKGRVRKVKY